MLQKIGVVITTYQKPHMLRQCLQCVFKQTLRPHQVVIIDNSFDFATREIVEKYFPTVIHKHFRENIGSPGG